MGTLYLLTSPAGKSYIGISSKNTEKRWAKHVEHALGKRASGALYAALRKYGHESFIVRTLVVCDDWKYLCELEIKAIAAYGTRSPNGYNVTAGGEGVTGERDESFRKKVSIAQRRRFEDPGERMRMREISRSISAEVRSAARERAAETMRRPEFRAKASETALKQFSTPGARSKLGEAIRASVTAESRLEASARMKILMADPQRRLAVSSATRAAMRRPETAEKVKVAARRRASDPNWRRRVSAAKLGKPLGPMGAEHRAKIAEARRAEWSDPDKRQVRMDALERARSTRARTKIISPHPFLQQIFDAKPELLEVVRRKRDNMGRYQLTSIHRIAGGAERHRPKHFLALETTKNMIASLKGDISPVEALRGAKGTYAVTQLVIAYMRWIDPSLGDELTL